MPKTPSFRYMGGKIRLRKWLISHFPKSGNRYLEPFVGLDNVFFLACQELDFKEWFLGDINGFLDAVTQVDLNELPEKVLRDDFEKWKHSNSPVAKVIIR